MTPNSVNAAIKQAVEAFDLEFVEMQPTHRHQDLWINDEVYVAIAYR